MALRKAFSLFARKTAANGGTRSLAEQINWYRTSRIDVSRQLDEQRAMKSRYETPIGGGNPGSAHDKAIQQLSRRDSTHRVMLEALQAELDQLTNIFNSAGNTANSLRDHLVKTQTLEFGFF